MPRPLAPVPAPAREAAAVPAGPPLLERDYWIEHCEGFRVDGARGRIGVVEDVRRSREGGCLLAIRTGLLGRRVLLVPTREVFEIVPRARRLWLRTPETAGRAAPATAQAASPRAQKAA